ncbi:zf-HC2 domain-containing protein [Paenibacillus alkalitolerans]|uniref:zf-HC2 domain-containing protein n=1 Tax=Paenibacillus alkalitolerans TaxID=2799335 RepID=UPI0018F5DCDD|nr:zf-HC2 domain-containing protein [Paenibacillus alkalitolerans]
MQCKEALPLMHDYLDGQLNATRQLELRYHLRDCPACSSRFRALEKTEALVKVLERPQTPDDLTAKIMANLPPAPVRRSWVSWVRRHPAATAAAAFLIVMISSFLSMWNQGTQLIVKGDDLDGVFIEGRNVIVPENSTMKGSLVVENGTVQVDGDVKGNLTVIDGKAVLASTAHISGQVTEVDRALDWIWYKFGEWYTLLVGQPQPQS